MWLDETVEVVQKERRASGNTAVTAVFDKGLNKAACVAAG